MTDFFSATTSDGILLYILVMGVMLIALTTMDRVRFSEMVTVSSNPRSRLVLGILGFLFVIIASVGILFGGTVNFQIITGLPSLLNLVILGSVLLTLGLVLYFKIIDRKTINHQKTEAPNLSNIEHILQLQKMLNKEHDMIDPTTIPILLKTLDFLFGEGSKILEERRERRKSQQEEKPKTEKKEKLILRMPFSRKKLRLTKR